MELYRSCDGVIPELYRSCGGIVPELWWSCTGVVMELYRSLPELYRSYTRVVLVKNSYVATRVKCCVLFHRGIDSMILS